ncbi:unnamed protein product, partial [Brassica rapa subsp. trilocularis]
GATEALKASTLRFPIIGKAVVSVCFGLLCIIRVHFLNVFLL